MYPLIKRCTFAACHHTEFIKMNKRSSSFKDNRQNARPTFKKDDVRGSFDKDAKPYKKKYDNDRPGKSRDDKPKSGGAGKYGDDKPPRSKPYSAGKSGGESKPYGTGSFGESKGRPDRGGESKPRRDGDKPYRSSDNKDRSFSDKRSADRPFAKSDRPYKKDDRSGDDRPKRSFDRSDKPFKRDDRAGDDRPKRSFDKSDRPYKKDDRSDSDRPKRSFDRSDKPFKRDDRSGDDRPKRSFDRSDKPFSDRPKRSFDKSDKPFAGKGKFSKDGDKDKKYDKDGSKKAFDKPKRGFDNSDIFKNESKRIKEPPITENDGVKGELQDEEKKPIFHKAKYKVEKKTDVESTDVNNKPASKRRKPKTEDEDDEVEGADTDGLLMPLNKYIAHSGECGRREAADLVKQGKVKVNGELVLDPGYKVTASDLITLVGKKLTPTKGFVYILLNKPKNFITTTDDPQGRKTVMDLVANSGVDKIYPVGRLDRDTTGLLLLTNDGSLTQKLSHPSYEIKKVYQVTLDKPLTKADFDKILEGVELEDGIAKVDALSYLDTKEELGLEIHSGRNRIVRRIFESLKYEVVKLDRVMYAGLTKKNLPRSKWRFLDEHEIVLLKHFKS